MIQKVIHNFRNLIKNNLLFFLFNPLNYLIQLILNHNHNHYFLNLQHLNNIHNNPLYYRKHKINNKIQFFLMLNINSSKDNNSNNNNNKCIQTVLHLFLNFKISLQINNSYNSNNLH